MIKSLIRPILANLDAIGDCPGDTSAFGCRLDEFLVHHCSCNAEACLMLTAIYEFTQNAYSTTA